MRTALCIAVWVIAVLVVVRFFRGAQQNWRDEKDHNDRNGGKR